ncbi:MAG: hypothetical protein UIB61_06505 [Treponema sp.]|nr:hypothetical protein [Treponema sp.]
MTLSKSIRVYGSVGTAEDFSDRQKRSQIERPDLYTAKINTIFLPFLKEDIPEKTFCIMQEKLKEIVTECMGSRK